MDTLTVPSRLPSTGWMARARCSSESTDAFFPSDGAGVLRAQKICASCPVMAECLDYALVNHIAHGVWGGASERQRRRLQRQRQQERLQKSVGERSAAVA